jgi:putative transposase
MSNRVKVVQGDRYLVLFGTRYLSPCPTKTNKGDGPLPRTKRRKSGTGIYHIMLRGINKQMIFEGDEDKGAFLKRLKKYKDICDYELYGYCLMDNHVHLLMKENGESISDCLQRISSSYVYWYNNKYERCGHLFQERFKSETIETEMSFKKVLRYIHQNPLKAGLAANIYESKWTSFHEYLKKETFIDTQAPLLLFSPNLQNSKSLFQEYMQQQNDDQFLEESYISRRTDAEVLKLLSLAGVPSISMLQQLDKSTRNQIIKEMKEIEGVSIRQLSRITGVSKSVIARV